MMSLRTLCAMYAAVLVVGLTSSSAIAADRLPQFALPRTSLPPKASTEFVDSAPIARDVRAGERISTPCFSIVAPIDSSIVTVGCQFSIYPGSGMAKAPEPYFMSMLFTDHATSLDGLTSFYLQSLAAGNPDSTREKPDYRFGAHGRYLGSQPVSMFGLDAREFVWGDKFPYWVQFSALLPKNRYSWKGASVTTLMIAGEPMAKSFKSTLASIRMR